MHEFNATLNGLHQLVDTVAPHAASLENSPISLEINVSKAKEEQFINAIKGHSVEERGNDPLLPEEAEKLSHELRSAFSEDPAGLRSLGMALIKVDYTPSQQELLHRALLAMCIASLEVLISGLVTYRYLEHKGALSNREVKFSLRELEDFEALSEVREFVISREVDRVMFKGLEGWSEWLVEHAGLKLEDLTPNYNLLFEAFQRRHAIVHNGGRASRIYRARLEARNIDPPELDKSLAVETEYLREVLLELTYVGLATGARTWAKWQPSDSALLEIEFRRYVDEYVEAGVWVTARRLANTGLELTKKEAERCHLKLAKALATKKIDGLGAAKEELGEWDASAVDRKFQLAIAAVEEDFDRVFQILEKTDMTRPSDVSWLRNPVFEEARKDPRWQSEATEATSS
ncbi:MAG TPA: hypothetical protein VFJ65_03360 [Solirubrobacterales bacterium]|nr:hypothetical protein [Solirubrobacterales bacterium]